MLYKSPKDTFKCKGFPHSLSSFFKIHVLNERSAII